MYHTIRVSGTLSYLVSQAIAYLLYPFLGWLADVYFTRYKFVKYSFIGMITGCILMCACATAALKVSEPKDHIHSYFLALGGLSLVICLVSSGMFESTAIQFGMDQMLEESSDKLSCFIHWYFWSSFLGKLALTLLMIGGLVYYSDCVISADIDTIHQDFHIYEITAANILIILMSALQLLTALFGLFYLIHSKKHLNIDRTGDNPIILLYKVLKYAWTHKYPEHRSAFTYWEEDIPKRIDLGKNKYGGPFTTEEVEDTKTFMNILLLLFSLLGFQLTGYGYSVEDQLMRRSCPTVWVLFMVGDPMFITLITVVVGVPLYRLIIIRFFQKHTPNMLKRIGLGLLCCLVKEATDFALQATAADTECGREEAITFISCYFSVNQIYLNDTRSNSHFCTNITNTGYTNCTHSDSPFIWLPVTSVLHGLSMILVYMTTLEFISAQAPLRLKGLLIGVLYSSLAINYLVGVTEAFTTNYTTWQIFHGVKILLMLGLFCLYVYVSRCYRYRLRDEVVNERFLVEEIYERELAEQHEEEQYQYDDDLQSEDDHESDSLSESHLNNPRWYGAIN